jgi:hypothetical protein
MLPGTAARLMISDDASMQRLDQPPTGASAFPWQI